LTHFPQYEGPDSVQGMEDDMDGFVQFLCMQDVLAREAVAAESSERSMEVSMAVTTAISTMPWGLIPTGIMHFAHHVNLARSEAGRLQETLEITGNTLRVVAGELAKIDNIPVELAASLMDLAASVDEALSLALYRPADMEEFGDCDH
jgi:hypothetical protein